MVWVYRGLLGGFRGVLCLAMALIFSGLAHAKSVPLKVDSHCGTDVLFVAGQVTDVQWQTVGVAAAKVPTSNTCWLRIHRSLDSSLSGDPRDQFLVFENSWGSNFSLFDAKETLLGRLTVGGERFRALSVGAWIFVPLQSDAPAVLYAQVESLNHFFTVNHRVFQSDAPYMLRIQKRYAQDAAVASLLFSAAVISLLFFVSQRNRDFLLFSCFAFLFSLTLFLDRGELLPFGFTASSDIFSLVYPLSGMVLAVVALYVGRFALTAPWAARGVLVVIALYGSMAVWQIALMLGMPGSVQSLETFSDYVYNTAALLQVLVFWGSFQAWRRGDKVNLLLVIGIAPLILFEIQISNWFAELLPEFSAALTAWLASSLRITSYLLLPAMFFVAIAYRARRAQSDAIRLARQDHLTNLPNRDHFLVLGQKVLDKDKDALLLAINIDRLKAINDVLGFQVGDEVIVQVGSRLSDIGLGVLARVQTNQFCLLLSSAQQLAEVRKAVDAAFAKPVTVLEQKLDVSLTIGVARHTGENLTALMRSADIALGVSRATKVNWLAYEPAMDTTRPESLSLLSELSRAIEGSELQLFLQPKVRLTDGKVTGAEALVRWHHPTRGMVPPNDFIPFAEQTGKISALTIWVIREGARITAQLRREGQPILVSLNISTNDLREPQFVERVVALVESQGALTSDLRLEVTESGMMENPQLSLTVLHALRDAGFSISIDDFGTGYSSLSYLQKMPVAELKIDRSFVRDVKAGSDGAELLDSIITLGHRMGLSVVAEGAETMAECALLQKLGCDFVQGWYVAKAMPAQDYLVWRKSNDPFALNTGTQS